MGSHDAKLTAHNQARQRKQTTEINGLGTK
jgi:hypothetical protein